MQYFYVVFKPAWLMKYFFEVSQITLQTSFRIFLMKLQQPKRSV